MLTEQKILSELLGSIQRLGDSPNSYLNYIGRSEDLYPVELVIQPGCNFGSKLAKGIFTQLGIRSLAINNLLGSFVLPRSFTASGWGKLKFKWYSDKITSFIEDLKKVFRNTWVIAFSDWATLDGASQLWENLLFEVIKPLNRSDFNFIFHLGDPTTKEAYDIEKILNLISNFSVHGKVTLITTEDEAQKLWTILHAHCGYPPETNDHLEKYNAVFEDMHIDRLLVHSENYATLVTDHQQVEFFTKSTSKKEITKQVKNNFNAGYSVGLMLEFEISQCIALGLTLSGALVETGTSPDTKALVSYINKCINDLKSGHSSLP